MNMKTKLMMMVVAVAMAIGAWADTGKVGDYTWTYSVNGGTAEIYRNGYAAISPNPTGAVEVKDFGTMSVTIGGTQFAGSMGKYHVQSADVGGDRSKGGAKVYVDGALVDGVGHVVATCKKPAVSWTIKVQ